MSSNTFRFDEEWTIPGAAPEEVYDVLCRGELLPKWWKGVYLEAVPFEPGSEPRIGNRLRAKARGFLPYRLNFVLELTELIPNRVVAVKVVGDFDGRWRAALSPKNGGTHVDLTWETELTRPWMKVMAPLLRPVFAWNHYWTTPRGEAGLRAYLTKQRKSGTNV